MKKIYRKFFIITTSLMAVLLTGCVKEPEKAPPVQYDKPANIPKPKISVRGDASFYSDHLDEALKKWESCQPGILTLQGAELADCTAARDAWHYQPYIPPKRTNP